VRARARFVAAGFTAAQALEVVLGIETYAPTTYTDRLTGAPLDPAFEGFRRDEDGTASDAE
jgi:hypothetical protein